MNSLFRILICGILIGGTWRQIGTDINGEAADDWSGQSVAMSKDGYTVAIGATLNDGVNGTDSGHVRVYSFNISSNRWVQVGLDIDGEASGDQSSRGLAMSDDGKTIAIGAPGNSGKAGHVRVYSYSATSSSWVQIGSDINGEAIDDQSGASVSVSADGKTVAVGAPLNNGINGIQSGHVRVFSTNPMTSIWTQIGSDIDGEAAFDGSGWSVAISNDGKTIAVGAINNDGNGVTSGHVRVYSFNALSGRWVQVGSDIDGETDGDSFGYSVAMSSNGTTIAVGAPFSFDSNGVVTGHVRVFSYNSMTGRWVKVGSDIDGKADMNNAGWSVCISDDGRTIALGAPGHLSNAGAARVYSLNSTSGNWEVSLDINGRGIGDNFGFSVAMSGDGTMVAVGGIFRAGSARDSGHVRIFRYELPTKAPTKSPTKHPTKAPSKAPTKTPTKSPTKSPSKSPTKSPSRSPTKAPSKSPTKAPSKQPTKAPTTSPLKILPPNSNPVPVTSPIMVSIPIAVPISGPIQVPVSTPTNCGIFGLNFFCPRRWKCGFWRRLFNIHGC